MTFQSPQRDFDLATLNARLGPLSLPERLAEMRSLVPGPIVFTTSFGLEDQALTHALAGSGLAITFATLDTGRLFDETLELWAETELHYGIAITPFTPDGAATEELIARDGPLGFRRSVAAREACCGVRKVEPLGRALIGAGGWLTGLRADQSNARAATPFVTADADRDLLKLSPLADWSREAVARYVADSGVPYNPLHDRGYPSIGCAPCTRAVRIGEPERAGRWWWEAEGRKECGLHNRPGHVPVAEPIPAVA